MGRLILSKKISQILCLIFLMGPPLLAKDLVPLNIDNGTWEVELNFSDFLTADQKAKMKEALAKLEQMKKDNPEMAAQMAQLTKGMSISADSVKKSICMTQKNMKAQMDKVLSQESSSDSSCKGEVVKSTAKYLEGKSICGDKTYIYKMNVINKKRVKGEIIADKGKVMKSEFVWLNSQCKEGES
jgi:hypothetical protein